MDRYPTPNLDKRAGVLDRRFEALLIDGFLVAFVVGLLGYVAGILFIDTAAFFGAIISVQFGLLPALIVYHVALEGYYGMTVGKSLRGIVIVQDDGSPITWKATAIRNVLRLVDSFPGFYIVGIVIAYATDKHQRLGDLLGNTVVVYTQE